ncbi:rhodanese domain-containing protein CG4456-like [Penaeus chinensis]|uniref:rhodanese domain-containing protein CG4456-like n=1 Tax=Penaeus chinensis TaxID=139456 RepID=UPI001FB57EE6|nr:rhodanese domain-containing protein CG4456-like [Penaeus chinensis]
MTDIAYEELSQAASELLLVDVRLREEVREQGQLPGSHVLPVQELEEALGMSEADFEKKYGFAKIRPGDERLVITCRSGRRVGIADEALKANGFSKHRLYRGSFLDWTAKGGPVEKPGKPYEPKE